MEFTPPELLLILGIKVFNVEGNQIDVVRQYIGARNKHYGTNVSVNAIYTNVDVYNQNEKGEWIKTKSEMRTYIKFEE